MLEEDEQEYVNNGQDENKRDEKESKKTTQLRKTRTRAKRQSKMKE